MIRRLAGLAKQRPSRSSGGPRPPGRREPVLHLVGSRKRVDLRDDARAAGRENHPTADATQLTRFETLVVGEFEGQHAERAEVARAELQQLSASFRNVAAQLPCDRDLTDVVVDAAADVDRELGTAGPLVALWSDREERLRDLRNFARVHGLARDARYPDSGWLSLGVLALLILLESWANSVYFAEATDFGLLGGFVRALGISLLNIVGGFVVGRFVVPWIAYRRLSSRILATAGTLLAAVFAVIFNVALAAYRDQMVRGAAADVSLRALLRDPLHLTFMSLALLGTGLLAFGLAVSKGYSADDPYPHYSSLDRRFRVSDLAFARGRDALVARVIARVRRVPSDSKAVLQRGNLVLGQLDAIVIRAQHVHDLYETDRQDFCARCTMHLREWREENSFIRTDPAPAYFGQYPPFSTLVPERLVGALIDRMGSARSAQARLEVEEHRILRENEGRLAGALERVQRYIRELVNHVQRRDPAEAAMPRSLSGREGR